MSYLVVSLPGEKKEVKGESKGGLDPKKGKRKIGKEGFLSYHVISMRGWGGFSLLSSANSNPISRTKKEKEKRRRRRRRGRRRRSKFLNLESIQGE